MSIEKKWQNIAGNMWQTMAASPLCNGKSIGELPAVRLAELPDDTHGQAFYDHIEIADRQYLEQDKFMHDVLAHELAHVAAERIEPGCGHGNLWIKFNRLCNGDASTEKCITTQQDIIGLTGTLFSWIGVLMTSFYFSMKSGIDNWFLLLIIAAGAIFLCTGLYVYLATRSHKLWYAVSWGLAGAMAIFIVNIFYK